MKNSELMRLRDVPVMLAELTGQTRTQATVYKWVTVGRTDYVGTIIKLRVIKRLGRYFTTKEWLEQFIRRIR